MYVLSPDRNNLLYGHCKGEYLPLYALFDMHPSDLICIIQPLASGQRRKQLSPLQFNRFLRLGDMTARQKGASALCVPYADGSYSSAFFENLSTEISPTDEQGYHYHRKVLLQV